MLYWRGTNNMQFASGATRAKANHFTITTNGADLVACSGNVETLLDYKEVAAGGHPQMGTSAFYMFFKDCKGVVPTIQLPATNLMKSCYQGMFEGCTSLTAAPGLPVTNLAQSCYKAMFINCTALTAAPELPATTLADSCYDNMFSGCTALTAAPELPATNLADHCYQMMFDGCTSLTAIPTLDVSVVVTNCCDSMFQGCINLVVNTEEPGKAWSIPADVEIQEGAESSTSKYWATNMFAGTAGTITNSTVVTPGTTYYIASAPVEFRVTQPEHATFQAHTNDVPADVPFTGDYLTDFTVTYTAADGYMFPGGYRTLTTNVTASAATVTVTLTAEQLPTAKSHTITYAYKTNDVDVVETELTGLVNEAQTTFMEIDSVEIETSKISLPRYRLVKAEPASWAAHEKTSDITVTISFDLDPIPPVTVVLPEVAGATARLLAFNVNGGWASVATNEVPSNATVRVVWTAEDGKALTGAGAVSVFQWQTELVASNSVQTVPQPVVGEAGESEITLNIDTRTVKKYFEKDDILPIWYAAGAEVEVKGEGEQSWTSLVKNAANTNTVAWIPSENGTYTLTQGGLDDATITLTTPVEVTTNGLEVTGTTVEVTVDGAALPEDGIVPSNSVVTATWTATGSDVCFMNGTKIYTQTFEARESVNPVSEAVTKPEEPKAPKLKLGVVAQRYPWDGKIDVQYWAQNTPNTGYEITITITLPDGTTASETKDCLSGKNWTTFDARAKFGEVQFPKGVKVKATLEKK